MKETKIAFWHSEHFPYILWAELVGWIGQADGVRAQVAGYGYTITPIALLSKTEAESAIEEILEIKIKREETVEFYDNRMRSTICKVFKKGIQ